MPRAKENPNELSIGRAPKPAAPEKVSWKLPGSLLARLALYRQAYKALYNDEIDEDTLVELILASHLSKDRAFMNWLKGQGKKPC